MITLFSFTIAILTKDILGPGITAVNLMFLHNEYINALMNVSE